MEPEAARLIGAGLDAIGLGGVGVGIGNVFATTIATIGPRKASFLKRKNYP